MSNNIVKSILNCVSDHHHELEKIQKQADQVIEAINKTLEDNDFDYHVDSRISRAIDSIESAKEHLEIAKTI